MQGERPANLGNGQRWYRFTGGMYAAPMHRPNAVATKKRYCEANVHGGRCARRRVSEANRRAAAALRPEINRPPYNARYTLYNP